MEFTKCSLRSLADGVEGLRAPVGDESPRWHCSKGELRNFTNSGCNSCIGVCLCAAAAHACRGAPTNDGESGRRKRLNDARADTQLNLIKLKVHEYCIMPSPSGARGDAKLQRATDRLHGKPRQKPIRQIQHENMMPTLVTLRAEAKQLGMRGYSAMRKPALLQAVANARKNGPLRCSAHTKKGQRCSRLPKIGGFCSRHARDRMLEGGAARGRVDRQAPEHPTRPPPPPPTGLKWDDHQAFSHQLRAWKMDVPFNHPSAKDLDELLSAAQPVVKRKLVEELVDLRGIKFQLVVKVNLRKDRHDSEPVYQPAHLRTKQHTLMQAHAIDAALPNAHAHLLRKLEQFTRNGSGWVVDNVDTLWLDIARFQPLKGGSYLPLPPTVSAKKAVINVQNTDDHCLRWSVRAALFPVKVHPERTSKYKTDDGLNFNGISAPTPLSQLDRVERQNGVALNVYGWDKGVVVHRLSDREVPADRRINLLLISQGDKYHYTLIKDLNRLLRDQTKHKERKHFCERCLHGFKRQDLLDKHTPDCRGINQTAIAIEMPKEGTKLRFENYHKQLKSPYIIYADFESIIEKMEGPENSPQQSSTRKTSHHIACGYSYIVVRSDGLTKAPVLYRGQDAAKRFLDALQEEEQKIKDELADPKPINMRKEDWKVFNTATTCHVCSLPLVKASHRDAHDIFDFNTGNHRGQAHKRCMFKELDNFIGPKMKRQKDTTKAQTDCVVCRKPLVKENYRDAVRDHCHITGKYRGAAHNECNLKLRINPKTMSIPVVFHNLRGYDSHLIMQAISQTDGKITCIPNNTEKYISFSLGQLRFIDSVQFLLSSLDNLVKATNKDEMHITARYEPDSGRRAMLQRKGVYPYEYMDSWKRFTEMRLPTKEAFYSKLSNEHITDEEYTHAENVWKTFGCSTLGDYHDLYLRTDVLLLADVFENFRKLCLEQYALDPANYYTSPGLSWDALLKHSGVELELLSDVDMHLFMEKGLRGGISMVSKRFAKANNPKVAGYDKSKPNTWIQYYDACNLYGWAMSQPLPVSGFQWATPDQAVEALTLPAESDEGYILEVDLEYPKELHDEHNAYPLVPERMKVEKEWMSEYQQSLLQTMYGGTSNEVEKLVPNLRNKERYVVHFRNLQLYLQLGMKLLKIHRALRFNQSPWMQSYIVKNTELRKKAESTFEQDLYKLMNNSVFGKTMENLRKRVDVKLVRADEEDKLRKLVAKPSFNRSTIFDDNLAAVHMNKTRLVLNRPVYVGMSILDLSKHLMYDWYYNNLKAYYGDRAQLLYTDTDSLVLKIQTEDVYADMAQTAEQYDTSNYPKDNALHSTVNKKVLGKMKDECAGVPIAEFVGLRPKMYSILTADEKEMRRAKGVKKYVVKKQIRHEQYKECLSQSKIFHHGMDMLRSQGHRIYGVHVNKISLSPLDTKRFILAGGVNTLAYGHSSI